MKKFLGTILLGFGLISNSNATAPGFYIGGLAGYSNTNNPSYGGIEPKNTGIAAGFFLGGNINEYIAVEGGYTHYAPSVYNGFAGPCSNPLGNTPQIITNGVNFLLKGMYPVKILSVFAKVGVTIISQAPSGSLNTSGLLCTSNKTNTIHPTGALGVAMDVTQNWQVDASIARVFRNTGVPKIDLVALAFSYHFVDKYCGQFLC